MYNYQLIFILFYYRMLFKQFLIVLEEEEENDEKGNCNFQYQIQIHFSKSINITFDQSHKVESTGK